MDREKERRILRVGQSVHNELSLMLLKDTKDPALTDVTITGVKMAQDLRRAKVFYSLLQPENKLRVHRSLHRAASFFQGKLGQTLQLRHTPVLQFVFDETPQKSARINELVNETKLDRQRENQQLSPSQLLAKRISEADTILLCCHRKPDGDALGSVLAMQRILTLQGRQSVAYVPDEIAPNLQFLPGVENLEKQFDSQNTPSLTIVLDSASVGQLPKEIQEAYSQQRLGHVAVVDHHASHDENFGHTVVRREISATGQLLFELVNELVWPMDDDIAQCIYTAMVADTGSFRYSNTTQSTFQTAAALMEYNIQPAQIAKELFDTFTLPRQRILGKVADTLQMDCDGKLATMTCSLDMRASTGATLDDLEGFVNIGRNVVGVEVAVLVTEMNDGAKASLRSNGQVDVAAIAAVFGGGGHRAAAGVTFANQSMQDALEALRTEVLRVLSK
ncbi:MAG: 30S ribosome-binding factor RbfA [Deltaproteobacteria bacterium]|nr:30S ribosome-binding factor RbfA [Deltaproteobacteria bacterium]MBN2671393.1 30S ribosome-binding factor RbfA [Deltaproteobacteria bacterium]